MRQNLVDRIVDTVLARRLVQRQDHRAFQERPQDAGVDSRSGSVSRLSKGEVRYTHSLSYIGDVLLVSVSNPLGMPQTNSQLASRAACSISSRVAVAWPNAMLDAIVPVNKTGS